MVARLRPATMSWPLEGSSARYNKRIKVVLPAPLCPVRKTNSPSSTCRLMSRSAVMAP